MTPVRLLIAGIALAGGLATGCARHGTEPTRDQLETALRAYLKDNNDHGGLRVSLPNVPDRSLTFTVELHSLIKRSCTGKDTVWTCNVNVTVSYPPLKSVRDSMDTDLIMFDGPGGWQVIK